ncbi:AP-3 complex subunit beta [Arachnomyces sp. PD_36]|nr:AP-3 complex subunit beta [Arachnomyces sp. PD_36]
MKPIRIVLDWDGTITKRDTLHIVAEIGYKRNRHLNLMPWNQIVKAYISDYTQYEDHYRPARSDRQTIAQESAWLASLNDVEERSVKRAQDAGIFTDVTKLDICREADHAIRSNEIQLRDGWKEILSMSGPSGNNEIAIPPLVSIISVNWSSVFIRACLLAALGNDPPVKGIADSIPIFSNHLHSEAPGIRTSADKLDAFKSLRDGGHGPIIYVGDSATDFDCLVAADVGICVRDEPMGSGQTELKESLERVGIDLARLDLNAWRKYLREIAGQGSEKESDKVVWWVTDLREVVSFAEKYNEVDFARELTLEVAQSANTNKGFRNRTPVGNVSFSQLKKLLDSRNDREILDGMRKVISLMYSSEPCLPFFSSVVKNVASPNIEIKKLVYIYLLHHAEAEPDLALLSINAIQKSLTDQNPQVRAMALRTMSGISVPVVSQIVSLAIKRGCGDMSPHVRKAAALAIPKCYRLDPNTLPQLLEYLSTLLGDNQYFVVGPAVSAFLEICPERIDLIHKNYRSIVKKLVDMDEWSQLATLRMLTVYARKCFPFKTQRVTKKGTQEFYDNEDDDQTQQEEYGEEVRIMDPDLNLFLMAAKPLLQSRNSAVIVSVVRAFLYLGNPAHLEYAIGPLVALLRSPQDIQHVALYNIVMVALDTPKPFLKYTLHFLVHVSDPPHIWSLKLEVLTILFPHCGQHLKRTILSELEHFSRGTDPELVRESVRAIGRCAQSDTDMSSRCLQILLEQISSPDENLVSEALTVIRHLIQQDPSSHLKTVIKLSKHLDTTTSPEARASIIWLVGEFSGKNVENNIAPDVLRILAKGFANESEPAKQQIVLLAAKVYLHYLQHTSPNTSTPPPLPTTAEGDSPFQPPSPPDPTNNSPIPLLFQYILLLSRYDTSYDLRDRARLYKSLLSTPTQSTHLASLLLLAPKPVPHTPSPSEDRRGLLVGSAMLVVGREGGGGAGGVGLRGYEELPDWVEGEGVGGKERGSSSARVDGREGAGRGTAGGQLDRALREHEGARGGKVGGGAGGVGKGLKDKSLDDWLAEEEEESSEEGSTEESSGEEEEEDDDDDEEETGSEEESEEEEEESEEEDEKETGKLMQSHGE